MTALRVGFDFTFAGRHPGGSSTYARSLRKALEARDDVSLEVVSAPRSGLPATLAWLVGGAHRRLVERSPDLVHCPVLVTPWRLPSPHVVTVHDLSSKLFPADHPAEWRAYETFFLPGRARAAARIITGTNFAREQLVADFGVSRERVVVTPYGVDPAFASAYGHRPAANQDGLARLLFPGAPTARKNLEAVLRAMAAARPGGRLAGALLEISGAEAASFPNHQEAARRLGLETRVRWLGRVPAERMPELVAAADLVVFPSRYEGFGFPALEAMAAGTPVVASTAACLPEVLGDGGLLVDADDDEALRAAVEEVLDHPERSAELVERGRRRAALFTWERCAELTVGVYKEVVASSR